MEFKIKDFSKISGISASNLRFFEQHGFNGVGRDTNGYRKYTIKDAYLINEFNSLTAQGYSLSEAADRCACRYPLHKYCEELKINNDGFESELELLKKKIEWNKTVIYTYEHFEELKNKVRLITIPDCVFVHGTDNEDPTPSLQYGKEFSQMVDILPASCYSAMNYKDGTFRLGMITSKDIAQSYGIDISKLELIQGGEFYVMLLETYSDFSKMTEISFEGTMIDKSQINYPVYGIYLMVETDKYGGDVQYVLIRK